MQTLEYKRSDSIETDDELPIQFGSMPKDLSVNMAFTLLATFRSEEGQSPSIKEDIEEQDAHMKKLVNPKDEPKRASNVKTKLEEFLVECLKNETNNTECSEDDPRIIILRPKKTQDGNDKPVRVVLMRQSERIA